MIEAIPQDGGAPEVVGAPLTPDDRIEALHWAR